MKDGMTSEIDARSYPDGEKTRFQIVSLGRDCLIEPLFGEIDRKTLDAVTTLFRRRLLPSRKDIGHLVLFYLEEGRELPFEEEAAGEFIIDGPARARFWLNRYASEKRIFLEEGHVRSSLGEVDDFLRKLEGRGCLTVSSNRCGDKILFLPLSSRLGFISDRYEEGRVLVNSHFFLLEFSDLETKYDQIGEPYGLLLSEGEIISPPLYKRQALLIDRMGDSHCSPLGIGDVTVIVGDRVFRDGENSVFFARPDHSRTPDSNGVDIAIVGRRIVGYRKNGGMEIPEAGFVLHSDDFFIPQTGEVAYRMDGDYLFGIQVGPLLVNAGLSVKALEEPYFRGEGTYFPPTVFPTCWETGRAARTGLAMKGKKPHLIWVEGSKPELFNSGHDSMGFTLSEFTELAEERNFDMLINLDGGGSSQMAVGNERFLRFADRNEETGMDFERPVPLGLACRFGAGGNTC